MVNVHSITLHPPTDIADAALKAQVGNMNANLAHRKRQSSFLNMLNFSVRPIPSLYEAEQSPRG